MSRRPDPVTGFVALGLVVVAVWWLGWPGLVAVPVAALVIAVDTWGGAEAFLMLGTAAAGGLAAAVGALVSMLFLALGYWLGVVAATVARDVRATAAGVAMAQGLCVYLILRVGKQLPAMWATLDRRDASSALGPGFVVGTLVGLIASLIALARHYGA